MSNQLIDLYWKAKQCQDAIAEKERELANLRDKKLAAEQSLMNQMAATAGDDGQPFTDAPLFVFGGVRAVPNSKLL